MLVEPVDTTEPITTVAVEVARQLREEMVLALVEEMADREQSGFQHLRQQSQLHLI
jgi:hypothetical protein